MTKFTKYKTITISHYHTDHILIERETLGVDFSPGQLLYLDYDGIYKLAISESIKKSNVIGIVWSIAGPNKIYLKVEPNPRQYNSPLDDSHFTMSDNTGNDLVLGSSL